MDGAPTDGTNFDRYRMEEVAWEMFNTPWMIRTSGAWLRVIQNRAADDWVGNNSIVQRAFEGLLFHSASSLMPDGTVKVSNLLTGVVPMHIQKKFFDDRHNTLPRYLALPKTSNSKQFDYILKTICSSVVHVLSESARCNAHHDTPSLQVGSFPFHYSFAELLDTFKTKLLDSREKISEIYGGEYVFHRRGRWLKGGAPHFELLCDLLRIIAVMEIVFRPQWYAALKSTLVTDVVMSKMGLSSPWNGHSIPNGNVWAYPHVKTRVLGPESDEPDEGEAAQIQTAIALSLSEQANESASGPADQAASGMAGASAGMPSSSADNGGPDDTSVVVDSDESDDVEDGP